MPNGHILKFKLLEKELVREVEAKSCFKYYEVNKNAIKSGES